MRFAFAGDRDIAVNVLRYLLELGAAPAALLVSGPGRASHADQLEALCGGPAETPVLRGTEFRSAPGVELLRSLELDLVIGVHFPYVLPDKVLALPRRGVVNLHPAFLPYNRGWHTPSWSLLEGTPIGATLHFMDSGVDTGDIIHQKALEPSPGDTAHTLYQRVKALELEVFTEAWPSLATGGNTRIPQNAHAGTFHRRSDLFDPSIQRIDPDHTLPAGELIRRLRALTTDRPEEAAYVERDGIRYHYQIVVTERAADNE